MSEWQRVKFEDLLVGKKISYGVVQPGQFQEVGGVPLIRVNNIKNAKVDVSDIVKIHEDVEAKYSKTRLSGGELLITVVGSVGECAIVTAELKGFNVARAVSVANIVDGIDKRFVAYQFRTEDLKFQMYGNTNDTVQPTLNLTELKQLSFTLPALPEQKAIASVLSSLDDKIDLLHRQNKTLEAMAETLFRQWFIEEAKEDWEELSVSDIAIHIKDNVNPSKDPLKTFYHFSLPAFDSGQKPTSELGSEILSNKYRVSKNSILVSKLNPRVPRIWLVSNVEDNYVCSTEFQNLKPKVTAHLMFLYSLFNSRDVIDELTMSASGTSGSHQRVKPEDMLNITFRTPSLDYLEQYSSLIAPSMQKVASNKQQIQTLENLRDTLLPKLMSGEVRVQYQTEEVA